LTEFAALLKLLAESKIEFIVIGGVAASTHGSARSTNDLDVVYARNPDNVARLAAGLAPLSPYLRGAPPGLPFRLDAETIRHGLNFTLTTSLGWLDLLGEVTGGGRYEDLLPNCIRIRVHGVDCLCLNLEKLIEVKRAAGRPKDFDAIAELEALREEREKADKG
jgi:predicted nucleotidyltransferase